MRTVASNKLYFKTDLGILLLILMRWYFEDLERFEDQDSMMRKRPRIDRTPSGSSS